LYSSNCPPLFCSRTCFRRALSDREDRGLRACVQAEADELLVRALELDGLADEAGRLAEQPRQCGRLLCERARERLRARVCSRPPRGRRPSTSRALRSAPARSPSAPRRVHSRGGQRDSRVRGSRPSALSSSGPPAGRAAVARSPSASLSPRDRRASTQLCPRASRARRARSAGTPRC
jgi:hypothetical protein